MKKFLSTKYFKENINLIIVFIVSAVLRLSNLGYSDYQGDEIKALYLPSGGESFFDFIINQKKGPIQFLITYLIKIVGISYDNQFLVRLPFAVVGVLSVIFFYKLINSHFGKKIAFYSSMFLATNGFLIAFSRIVQYQSFTIFFMIMCLYFLSLAVSNINYIKKGIYLGLICWALSILSHYDGFFIFPFVIYLLVSWFKRTEISKSNKIFTFLSAGLISLFLLLIFYVPFLISLTESTKDYWSLRISGEGMGRNSSSKYLFTVYHPIYVIHIYIILFILGLAFISLGLLSKYCLMIKKLPSILTKFFTHTTELMGMVQKEALKIYILLIWIIVPVIFYEKLVYSPGTHIYNYIIPMLVVLSFGLVTLQSLIFKIFEYNIVRIFNLTGVLVLFSFLIFQSYAVFVDNYREYPWEEENFLIWRFPKPNREFTLLLFGFPYSRDWEGIRYFVKAHPEIGFYVTNEKTKIADYYLGIKEGDKSVGFYIYIKEPQSFTTTISNKKAIYWSENYEPVYTVTRYGRDMVRVYIMEAGSYDEIIQKGYWIKKI